MYKPARKQKSQFTIKSENSDTWKNQLQCIILKGPGSIRGVFGLRFSKTIKVVILCGFTHIIKGNMPQLQSLYSRICLHVHCCHGDTDK